MTIRNAAVIGADDVIVNVVVVDTAKDLPDLPGLTILPDGVEPIIGWRWDGTTLSPPPVAPEPVPTSVTRFQAKAALHLAGLLDAVEAAVASADRVVQIAWSEASVFERSSPTIAALAAALSLSDAQLDDLFRAAATITA